MFRTELHIFMPYFFRAEFISYIHELNSINARFSASSLQMPRVKSFGKSGFLYTGIKVLNSLPSELHFICDETNYMKAVNRFL